jgi:hypothetical protein
MYMLILNFTYPLRCLRVPPVEYHCSTSTAHLFWLCHFFHSQDETRVQSSISLLVPSVVFIHFTSPNFTFVLHWIWMLLFLPYNVRQTEYWRPENSLLFYRSVNQKRSKGRETMGGGGCRTVYQKFSGLAAWSENCKWYSSLPVGAVVSLFCESA